MEGTGPRSTVACGAETPNPHPPIPQRSLLSDNQLGPWGQGSFRQGVPFWLRQNLHLNGPSQVPDAAHVLSPLLSQVSMPVYGIFAQLVLLLALPPTPLCCGCYCSGTVDQQEPPCPAPSPGAV